MTWLTLVEMTFRSILKEPLERPTLVVSQVFSVTAQPWTVTTKTNGVERKKVTERERVAGRKRVAERTSLCPVKRKKRRDKSGTVWMRPDWLRAAWPRGERTKKPRFARSRDLLQYPATRGSGGGGNRTRVPWHFSTSFYVRSRLFGMSSIGSPIGRLPARPVEDGESRPGRSRRDPRPVGFGGRLSGPSDQGHQSGLRVIRQPRPSCDWHLSCDRLFTWATDQPRHATDTSTCPVEASSPPILLNSAQAIQYIVYRLSAEVTIAHSRDSQGEQCQLRTAIPRLICYVSTAFALVRIFAC